MICTRYQGMNHNFVRKLALFDAAGVAVAQIAAALSHRASTFRKPLIPGGAQSNCSEHLQE